jgi:D-galacturonate reductase
MRCIFLLFRSIESFVDAVRDINSGIARLEDFDHTLASVATTYRTTAVLEAGRRSLDEQRTIRIVYDNAETPGTNHCVPTGFQ